MLVRFAFSQVCGRTEGTKKTATTDLIAALGKPIWLDRGEVNRVKRVGAFSRGQSKKLPWVEAIAAELTMCLPVKAEARKEGRSLARRFFVTGISVALNGCCGGGTRPWQRLADCRCRYTSFSATISEDRRFFRGNSRKSNPTTGRSEDQTVGATTDPRHGCSVNTTESASRLTRLHRSCSQWSGLNGWGCCAFSSADRWMRAQERTER